MHLRSKSLLKLFAKDFLSGQINFRSRAYIRFRKLWSLHTLKGCMFWTMNTKSKPVKYFCWVWLCKVLGGLLGTFRMLMEELDLGRFEFSSVSEFTVSSLFANLGSLSRIFIWWTLAKWLSAFVVPYFFLPRSLHHRDYNNWIFKYEIHFFGLLFSVWFELLKENSLWNKA